VSTRCLSFHASYRCQDSGACCTAGWPIPVEADRFERLGTAISRGDLRPVRGNGRWHLAPAGAPPDTPALLRVVNHACTFHDGDAHRCAIHRALGHDALPLACRQFPRVVIRDPRGVSITLSHYCPTAASLLARAGNGFAIVSDAAAFPATGEYVGLDGRGGLPPLLRPGMLMDWDSWWYWEQLTVDSLSAATDPPAVALARLSHAVDLIRRWHPSDGALSDAMRMSVARSQDIAPRQTMTPELMTGLRAEIERAIPADLAAGVSAAPRSRGADDQTVLRFIAAHAFANWTAHLGGGLRSWLRSIEAAYALVATGDSVGDADLKLRHLTDPHALALAWSLTEV